MEPDTSSWQGLFTKCGGIPRMMAGSMVVAVGQVGANNIKQTAWWWSALLHHLSGHSCKIGNASFLG